jgi:plastocyanin
VELSPVSSLRRLVGVVLITVVAIAFGYRTQPASATTRAVDIVDGGFSPATLDVLVGETVVWHNTTSTKHTVTDRPGLISGSRFDSGAIEPDASYSRTFSQVGDYRYLCMINPNMTASLRVMNPSSSSTSAPPPAVPDSSTSTSTASSTAAADTGRDTTGGWTPAEPVIGYWMLGADGHVFAFGDAVNLGESVGAVPGRVDLVATPSSGGYWILNETGGIVPFGDAKFHGAPGPPDAGDRYVSLAPTPDAGGYWVFSANGHVLAFGNARSYGDLSTVPLNGRILDSVATPSGQGYWMVGSDGGIFSFGDARFFGSMGDIKLNKPVTSMVPDPDGVGYWLVASDGGIFAFQAPFYGSTGAIRLNKPIAAMVGGPGGYLMVGGDGGIFSFGDIPFFGSLGAGAPAMPVVAVAVSH